MNRTLYKQGYSAIQPDAYYSRVAIKHETDDGMSIGKPIPIQCSGAVMRCRGILKSGGNIPCREYDQALFKCRTRL